MSQQIICKLPNSKLNLKQNIYLLLRYDLINTPLQNCTKCWNLKIILTILLFFCCYFTAQLIVKNLFSQNFDLEVSTHSTQKRRSVKQSDQSIFSCTKTIKLTKYQRWTNSDYFTRTSLSERGAFFRTNLVNT